MDFNNDELRDDALIPVRILGIYPYGDPNDPRQLFETFLVFLKGEEDKVVPISIGRFEGQALAMAMRKLPPVRPLPYNLLSELVEKLDSEVKRLVIHTLKEEVFHASLIIETTGGELVLDCRPSDGMTLATLAGVQIYMNVQIIDEAGRELNGLLESGELSDEPINVDVGAEDLLADESPGGMPEPPTIVSDADGKEREEEMSELEKLRAQLCRLVAEEAYEEAARVRDLISDLVRQST